MEMKDDKIANACGFSCPESPVASAAAADDDDKEIKDGFYKKLVKLHDSSGLSLLFDFQESNLDLHLLYEEVIQRGGFYQVTEAGKWDEVELALKLKSSNSILPAQLQKVYEILLLQYEQVYSKSTDEANSCPDKNSRGPEDFEAKPGSSMGKKKNCDGNPNGHDKKRKRTGSKMVNQKSTVITSSELYDKELCKRPDAPMKPRTGYHIFVRLECNRLKMIHGENVGSTNLRNMATKAWKALSDKEKKPYLEASKIDRERYGRELARYMSSVKSNNVESQRPLSKTSPSMVSFSPTSGVVDDYHVSLGAEADSENIQVPDESMVKLAVESLKNARSNDHMFQIDFSSGFLNMPN